jgi:hypothetical protein
MAIEYDLTLAGVTPVNVLAARALPTPGERPTGTAPLLTADLYDKYGFAIAVLAEPDGYVEARADQGRWEWEPGASVSISFRLDSLGDPGPAVINALTIVRRVLSTGSEDGALVLNGDVLLLTRLNGKLVKYNQERWWSFHPAADQLIASME